MNIVISLFTINGPMAVGYRWTVHRWAYRCVQKVIDLVLEKKNQREHEFLDTLLKRLYV